MAFRYFYPITDDPQRKKSGIPDTVPARGTIWTIAPSGTVPDLDAKGFHRARLVIRTLTAADAEVAAGTADITLWYRDITERGDANNVNPDPPDALKVMWVKGPSITLDHLEEYILEDIYMRGVYAQVTAFAGVGVTQVWIYFAPYDRWHPFASID